MEKGHFGLDAHEHIAVGAIIAGFEEDIPSVVGEALSAEGRGGERDAPQGLDGIDIYLYKAVSLLVLYIVAFGF